MITWIKKEYDAKTPSRSQYTITNWEKICKLYPKELISLLKNDKFRKQRLKGKKRLTSNKKISK